jgi:hypothetical protein
LLWSWRLIALATVLLAGAARAGESSWPPKTLAETHPEAAGVRPFSPQYPLWTDGATKRRSVWLPRRATIDARDPEAWRFPIGTRFWKEFSFDGRKVETRYLEKTGRDTWLYATYVWSEDQREATLAPVTGQKGALEIAPGVRHDIPSVSDCKACHEGKGRDVVLGFGALQLSADRDPLAPHAEPPPAGSLQLAELLRENRLAHAPPSWKDTPPVVTAGTPRGRAVLGYLHGNCSFCHNDRDPVSSVGLSLRAALTATSADEQPAMRSAVNTPSKFQIRGVEPGLSQRLAAGDVERSAVLVRMRARDGMSQMPPLGSKRVDAAALELISAWVVDDLPAGGNGYERRGRALTPSSASQPDDAGGGTGGQTGGAGQTGRDRRANGRLRR